MSLELLVSEECKGNLDLYREYVHGVEGKTKSVRKRLNQVFSQTDFINLVRFAVSEVIKPEIPELIPSENIEQTIGRAVYKVLNIPVQNPSKLLKTCIPGFGLLNKNKCEVYIKNSDLGNRKTLAKAFFDNEHKEQNAKFLVKYAFENHWKHNIPELTTQENTLQTIGCSVYTALGLNLGTPSQLLQRCITGYGVLDDIKCEEYIRNNELGTRKILAKAFFDKENEHAKQNAQFLVKYAFENHWKHNIPELTTAENIIETIGSSAYTASGLKLGTPSQLLRRCISGYGVLDDIKCEEYIRNNDLGTRKILAKAFFDKENEHAKQNAQFLVKYAFENHWKHNIPELTTQENTLQTIGNSVYTALDLKPSNPSQLLEKCIDNYGILSLEKALIIFEEEIAGRRKADIYKTFFSSENDKRLENAENYLSAYQQYHEKRKVDFDDSDLKALPEQVKELLNIQSVYDLQKVARKSIPHDQDVNYHVVQIRWTETLEEKLKELLKDTDNKEKFIKDNASLWWSELGTTSFAVFMKAQKLGIIPETVIYGNGTKDGFPVYQFIENKNYPYRAYAQSTDVNTIDEVVAHIFTSPKHAQNFHITTPINYKGITEECYTKKEWNVIKSLSAYLEDPNQFQRIERKQGHEHQTPEIVNSNPRIVPMNLEEDLKVQITLPTNYSSDKHGIHTTRITNQNHQIYLLKHKSSEIAA